VAFLEALAARELAPRLRDVADVLVAHDDRRLRGRGLVELHVGAADAADLDLEQRRVLRDVGHGVFADLRGRRSGPHSGQYFFQRGSLIQWIALQSLARTHRLSPWFAQMTLETRPSSRLRPKSGPRLPSPSALRRHPP